jgi:anti-anti-sigma factor
MADKLQSAFARDCRKEIGNHTLQRDTNGHRRSVRTMEMRVLSDDGDVLRVEVIGRIEQGDLATQPEPMGELLGPRGYLRNVLVSLAQTQFIDSSGLSWLVVCHKRFCQAGGRLVFHSVQPVISQLFKLMRLDLALYAAKDEAAALELVRRKTS